VVNHVEKLLALDESGERHMPINMVIKGLHSNSQNISNSLNMLAMFGGPRINYTQRKIINQIGDLFDKGTMSINTDLYFKDKVLKKFVNLGFSYDNKAIPLELEVSGVNSNDNMDDFNGVLLSKVQFKVNFKNKRMLFDKVAPILMQGNKMTKAELDKVWEKAIKENLRGLEEEKEKVKGTPFVAMLDSVKNILSNTEDVLNIVLTSKNPNGVGIKDAQQSRSFQSFIKHNVEIKATN
jgi:hypothetical protein